MSSAFRRTSYASVAAGNAPTYGEHSPPGAATRSQQRDDPSSRGSTPQQTSRSHAQLIEMEGIEHEGALPELPTYKNSSAMAPFVPSYLKHSRLAERLENARASGQHSAREARSHHTGSGLGSRQPSSSNLALHKSVATAPHRATGHDVIDRLPPSHAQIIPKPLPSRWSESDKCSGLEAMANGLEVKYTGNARTPDDAAAVRSDHPIPQECGIYFFEVTILSKGKEGLIGIGFSGTKPSLNRLPGWETDSWGYHGDDGYSFACSATGKAYGPKFSAQDVIGCGINFRTKSAFFTKNGIFLGR